MKADISHITTLSAESNTVPGLSIDFKNMGGVGIRENRTTLKNDLRGTKFLLNGKEITVEESSKFSTRTSRRIHESWKFSTTIAQNFIFKASMQCEPPYSGAQESRALRKFSVNEKKEFFGHTSFDYLSPFNFLELDEGNSPTGKQLDGILKISGTFTRGLLGFGHVCTMKVTLSLCKSPNIEKSEIRLFLTQLKQLYFHDPLIFKKKLEANVRRRLTTAFLLNVAAVTPALLLIIIPLLSGLGLAIPLIGLAGAGIAVASFALLFGVATGAYAIYYKLAKDQPKIKEVELDLSSYDVSEKKAEAENQSIIMKLRMPLLTAAGLSSAIVTPLLILTLIPLFSAMGLPALAIAGIGAGISLATLGILFSASVGIRSLSNHILNFLKPPPAQTEEVMAATQPSIAQRTESALTQSSSVQDPLDLSSILNRVSTGYREVSDAGGLPHAPTEKTKLLDSEEQRLSPTSSISRLLA